MNLQQPTRNSVGANAHHSHCGYGTISENNKKLPYSIFYRKFFCIY
ncbi:hypothetical protein SH2C18_32110 [Clostridium sediminicola]